MMVKILTGVKRYRETGMDETVQETERDTRRGIQSVEVGFSLIDELTAARGKLPLKTLAERANMSPSKAHLYLVSFVRLGLVVQDRASSRYGLGPAALQLGLAAINQLDAVELARERLPALVDAAGTSISLSVWGNHGPTIVYRLDSDLPVPVSVRVGYVLPLLGTATGRTFMAHLPEREWAAIAHLEEKLSPGVLEMARALLPQIRTSLTAVTSGETHRGFFGVSSPIFGADNRICAAVTALGLSDHSDLTADGPVARAVRDAARRMSADLGATHYDQAAG